MAKKILLLGVFLLIFVGLIVRNYALKDVLFHDWDESIYAQIGYEMLQNKSLNATYNGSHWLEKPPFLPALLGVTFAIFSRSEDAARGLMLLLGFTLLIMVYLLTKKLFEESDLKKRLASVHPFIQEYIYLLPTLTLAGSYFFLDRSAIVNVDILLAISWVGYFLCRENFYAKLFFLTIGVLSKSFLGFYPLIFELLFLNKKSFSRKNFRAILLLIIPLIWHIYALLRFKQEFIQVNIYDHLLKRLTTPLELHFGSKFYYFELLYEDFSIYLIIFTVGLLILGYELIKKFLQSKDKKISTLVSWPHIILMSSLPYLALLTVGKSKISWYIFALIPLMSLVPSYLASAFNKKLWKYVVIAAVVTFFITNFIPSTYLFQPDYKVPDKTQVATCLSQTSSNRAAFLVDQGERDVQHLLEAANLQIRSSFVYGGSPSFVYYVQKKVDFYYDVDKFKSDLMRYNTIVVNKSDLTNDTNFEQSIRQKFSDNCTYGQWLGLTKR